MLVALLPTAACALALASAVSPQADSQLSCRVAPNGRVLRTTSDCPLRTNDLVISLIASRDAEPSPYHPRRLAQYLASQSDSLAVVVQRGGRRLTVNVPIATPTRADRMGRVGVSVIVVALLLGVPFGILRRSSAPSALPLALMNSITAAVAVALICGPGSPGLDRLLVAAAAAMPAATVHLGLLFPNPRRRLLSNSVNIALLYGVTLWFGVAALAAFERNSGYWPIMIWTIAALEIGAWCLLLSSCAFAYKEAANAVERKRTAVLGGGALLLPMGTTAVLMPGSPTPAEILTTFVVSAGAGMTLPVALAVSRYDLYSLDQDVRRVVARGLYVLGSAVATAAVWALFAVAMGSGSAFEGLAPSVLATVVAVTLLGPTRGRALAFLDGHLNLSGPRLAAIHADLASRLARHHSSIEITSVLGDAIGEALSPESGWVYLREGDALAPTARIGASHARLLVDTRDVDAVLSSWRFAHLRSNIEARTSEERRLLDRGVCVVIRLSHGGEELGGLVLGSPCRAIGYSRQELDFLRSVCAQTSGALHNARLAERLIEAESEGSRTTLARGLLHDVGKEVDWIRMISGRLPDHLSDEGFVRRDLEKIRTLSRALGTRIRDFLSKATSGNSDSTSITRTVERAVETIARLHPSIVVDVRTTPDVELVRADAALLHVATNLLDNAVAASKPGDSIQVRVFEESGVLVIRVADEGIGLEGLRGRDPFALGYTTKAEHGGMGVGLAYCKEIVEAQAGSIVLVPNDPRGAIAEIRVPLDSAADGASSR